MGTERLPPERSKIIALRSVKNQKRLVPLKRLRASVPPKRPFDPRFVVTAGQVLSEENSPWEVEGLSQSEGKKLSFENGATDQTCGSGRTGKIA